MVKKANKIEEGEDRDREREREGGEREREEEEKEGEREGGRGKGRERREGGKREGEEREVEVAKRRRTGARIINTRRREPRMLEEELGSLHTRLPIGVRTVVDSVAAGLHREGGG